jgi:hypothetical protein
MALRDGGNVFKAMNPREKNAVAGRQQVPPDYTEFFHVRERLILQCDF